MMSSTTQFDLNKAFQRKRIKTILTKPSRHVYPPEDLNILLKKGIKIKNLQLIKTDRERKSFQISLIKKLTRTCKYLHGIQIDRPLTEDINNLLKIQCKIRGIQSLQFISIDFEGPDVCKRIKKLLVRFKYLKKYKSECDGNLAGKNQFVFNDMQSYLRNKISLNDVNHDQPEKTSPLETLTKKNFCQNDCKKAQKLILGMRNRLNSLVSLEESQSSFTFAVNIAFDFNKKEFDKKMLGFICRFKRRCPLDSITLPASLKDRVLKILPFIEANQLNVVSQLDFEDILKEREFFEMFLYRKDAKILLDPSSRYSWENLLHMTNFGQHMFLLYNSVIDFKDFTFNFHAPLEVRQALLTRFKQEGIKWERVIFLFKTDSFDWLQEDERSCLKNMINELCKEESKNKYSEIHFEMAFKSAFDKELLENNIFSVIKELVQGQQKAKILRKYSLKINFEGANVESLLLFLGLFQQIPETICVLRLEIFSENIKNITNKLQNYKLSKNENFMRLLKDLHQNIKYIVLRAEKIKNYLSKLKENNSFMEIIIPQVNEIDELQRLFFKVGKKICDEFTVNVDYYLK